MVTVKYVLNSKPLFRGTNKWLEDSVRSLKQQGLPNYPIERIVALKLKIYYQQMYRHGVGNINNLDNAKLIQKALIMANVFNDETALSIPSCKLEGRRRVEGSGVEIFITLDETSKYNKHLKLTKLPIM